MENIKSQFKETRRKQYNKTPKKNINIHVKNEGFFRQ